MKDLKGKKLILLNEKEIEMIFAFVHEILDGKYSFDTKQTALDILNKIEK